MANQIPDGITKEDVITAITDFDRGVAHGFAPSTRYDLAFNDRLYPPKAIIGLAARRLSGRTLTPDEFSGGLGSRCFRELEALGFEIRPKPGIDATGFAVIVENDESQWNDETGVRYHFPARYRQFLPPGTPVLYYKGRMKSDEYKNRRLTPEPHYFGLAQIGKLFEDSESDKGDWYATIDFFTPFETPVHAKTESGYYEEIPENRLSNYWRDGVRSISEDVYDRIVHAAMRLNPELKQPQYVQLATEESQRTKFAEGAVRTVLVNAFERSREARDACVAHYGFACTVCGFDFAAVYGAIGDKFIHVHHLRELSRISEEYVVDALSDLRPVCANCHAMLHTRKPAWSLDELKELMYQQKSNPAHQSALVSRERHRDPR